MPVRAKPLPSNISKRFKKSHQKNCDEESYWLRVEERDKKTAPSARQQSKSQLNKVGTSTAAEHLETREAPFVQKIKRPSSHLHNDKKYTNIKRDGFFVQTRIVTASTSEIVTGQRTLFVQKRKQPSSQLHNDRKRLHIEIDGVFVQTIR